jgi:branched-chain amino acid aminotransferase
MLDIDFDEANGGWQAPIIRPNDHFMLEPANATFHYSIECFEGLKAYVAEDDRVIMFRPDKNFARMNQSHN